jgi:hypothetical protein
VAQGHPLSYWLARLDNGSDTNARAAIKEMGPAALPVLERTLHLPASDDKSRVRALQGIRVLGLAAKSSEPRLRELLNDPLFDVRQAATNALVAITGVPAIQPVSAEKADRTFNMPHVPVQQVLDMYANLVGKTVELTGGPVSAPVRFVTSTPLTKTQATQSVYRGSIKGAGWIGHRETTRRLPGGR